MGHLKTQYGARQDLDQADKLVGCEVLGSFALAHSGIHVAEYSVGVEMVQPIVRSQRATLCIFELMRATAGPDAWPVVGDG
jgi:hypothetical protein